MWTTIFKKYRRYIWKKKRKKRKEYLKMKK